jgi:hypothetical protein
MHNIPKRTVGLALAVLALAGTVVVSSGATAQDPTPRTLTFKTLEKGSTFKHVRNSKPKSERANPFGDVIVFTNPVADGAGRAVGTLYANCTTTKGARDFRRSTTTCTGVVALPDGTLTVAGNNRPGVATTTGAVTGGTGSYANARGVFVANDVSGDLTVTLAD